jgi:hypothetical protein
VLQVCASLFSLYFKQNHRLNVGLVGYTCPPGPYLDTCYCAIANDALECYCPNKTGVENAVVLANYDICKANSIVNKNGVITCT